MSKKFIVTLHLSLVSADIKLNPVELHSRIAKYVAEAIAADNRLRCHAQSSRPMREGEGLPV